MERDNVKLASFRNPPFELELPRLLGQVAF